MAHKPLSGSLSCLNIHVDVILIPPIIVHLGSVIGLHVDGASFLTTSWIISKQDGHNTFFFFFLNTQSN